MKQGNVSLRAPEPEDLEVMLSFENDAALWELGTATGPYSRYQMKRYIAESQNDLYADGQLRLMIVCEEQGVAGIVDVFSFDARHNRAEVGIVYIAESQNDLYADGQLRLMIVCEEQGVAGIVDVFSFDARHNRAEVGIVVRKDLRGQGVAQAALSLLESHCFSLLGLRQLYAYVPVGHNRAEVGIVVRKDLRGQGVAQAALSLLESHCFSLLGLRQLYAYVPVGNVASRKLFTSAGYTERGILKDWIRVGTSYQDVCFFQKINEL